jgi:hypothetical protein
VKAVLEECRALSTPSPEDMARMATATSVGPLVVGSKGAHQVLQTVAQSLPDEEALKLFAASPNEDASRKRIIISIIIILILLVFLLVCLKLLAPDSPTLCVARVLARKTIAPVAHALKDACPLVFNVVKRSWSVRVEIFPSQTVVTHSRVEQSAPGHDEIFKFAWSVSFILRGAPLEICELFLELTHVECGNEKLTHQITGVFVEEEGKFKF